MMRTLLHRRACEPRDERGAVMVLVAVTLPVLVLFVAFAIEVGALVRLQPQPPESCGRRCARGCVQYGGTCFGTPHDRARPMRIGKVAQQYAGPPAGTPDLQISRSPRVTEALPEPAEPDEGDAAELPHAPELEAVLAPRRRRTGAWEPPDTPATARLSAARRTRTETSARWSTCASRRRTSRLFFPLFGFRPTISAHARAALEGEASTMRLPSLSGTPASRRASPSGWSTPATDAVIQTVTLAKEPPNPQPHGAGPVGQHGHCPPPSRCRPPTTSTSSRSSATATATARRLRRRLRTTGLLMINNHPSATRRCNRPAAPAAQHGRRDR